MVAVIALFWVEGGGLGKASSHKLLSSCATNLGRQPLMFIEHLLCSTLHPECAPSALHDRCLRPIFQVGGLGLGAFLNLPLLPRWSVWPSTDFTFCVAQPAGDSHFSFSSQKKFGPNVSCTLPAIRAHTSTLLDVLVLCTSSFKSLGF